MADYYITDKISQHKGKTPEGYLVIKDVAVSRIGTQDYMDYEMPSFDANERGIVTAIRNPEWVFERDSITSFIGKSVTFNHPSAGVDPSNYKMLEVGTITDARADIASGLVRADFIIKDPEMIAMLQAGNVEVSVGYTSDNIQLQKGVIEQTKIRVNHVALVPSGGRCGAVCSTRDHSIKDSVMELKEKLFDAISSVFSADAKKDEKMEDKKDMKKDESHEEAFDAKMKFGEMDARMKEMCDRMEKMEKSMDLSLKKWAAEEEKEAAHEDEKMDDKKDMKDAAPIVDADYVRLATQDLKTKLAVVSPEFKHDALTTDHAGVTKIHFDNSVCTCKRQALDSLKNSKHSDLHKDYAGVSDEAITHVFDAMYEVIRTRNNAAVVATKAVEQKDQKTWSDARNWEKLSASLREAN